MPLKMIGIIILAVICAVFAGLNLDNRCDVNLVFYRFQNVPVFFSIFFSFIAGMIVMLPFAIGGRKKTGGKKGNQPVDRTSGGGEEKLHD